MLTIPRHEIETDVATHATTYENQWPTEIEGLYGTHSILQALEPRNVRTLRLQHDKQVADAANFIQAFFRGKRSRTMMRLAKLRRHGPATASE
eukprot:SAG11_NODE_1350_length_5137_cov_2.743152_5_plen_93_part_00